MRVGIVTLYNSFNFGSVLQAYALQQALLGLGHEVEFVNLETRPYWKKRYYFLASRDPAKMMFNIRRAVPFFASFRSLNTVPKPYARAPRPLDAVVVGSDEIWNVKNPTFYQAPQFLGRELDCDRVISYAASCGYAGYEDLAQHPTAAAGIAAMQALSVRDTNTCDIVSRLTGRLPELVIDPTFLVDFEPKATKPRQPPYVLIYGYTFSPTEAERIRSFATRQNLQVISAGLYHPWSDRSVVMSPFEFLDWMRHAAYVVTNTFHGTVFSIILGKSFGSLGGAKPKVASLLADFGLTHRDVEDTDNYEDVLLDPIDWDQIGARIQAGRRQSLAFLEAALRRTNSEVSAPTRQFRA